MILNYFSCRRVCIFLLPRISFLFSCYLLYFSLCLYGSDTALNSDPSYRTPPFIFFMPSVSTISYLCQIYIYILYIKQTAFLLKSYSRPFHEVVSRSVAPRSSLFALHLKIFSTPEFNPTSFYPDTNYVALIFIPNLFPSYHLIVWLRRLAAISPLYMLFLLIYYENQTIKSP